MSDNRNILELLVDCVWDCGVAGAKMISKFLGLSWDEHDFKKFFSAVSLCNNEGEYPKLQRCINNGIHKVYIFNVPIGLTIDDFEKTIKPLSYFMKLGEDSMSFSTTDDLSAIELRLVRFDEFFRHIELHNDEGIHPKFKEEKSNDIYDSYIFINPKGVSIGDYRKNLIKVADYFKLDLDKLQLTLKGEDNEVMELKVFK